MERYLLLMFLQFRCRPATRVCAGGQRLDLVAAVLRRVLTELAVTIESWSACTTAVFGAQHHRRPPPLLPALYKAAAADLPTLADPGYEGIGILIPLR